jgi:hypothetical protein
VIVGSRLDRTVPDGQISRAIRVARGEGINDRLRLPTKSKLIALQAI